MTSEAESQPILLPSVHFAHASSFKFKQFIKEKTETEVTPVRKTVVVPELSGSAVKKEYDRIVCDATTSSANSKLCSVVRRNISKKKSKAFDKVLTVNALMRAVERDDVKTVGEYLEHNLNFVVDSRDEFGWSALMCASCAGAENVVKLLLNCDIDVAIKDKKGNDCLSLAKSRGNKNIVKLIEHHINNPKERTLDDVFVIDVDSDEAKNSGSYYCKDCKESMPTSAKPNHLTSTVHNFNAARKSGLKTSYGISESNKGFQMLLKTGWDREKGLGPEGEGHKFPPKVMLKQDRTGLGVNKYVAKVTHNLDDVPKKRLERTNTINKRQKEKKLRKDKMKDRELRRILS
ncbi:G patch domain and ankyrin repeat-containing protein 1 homolog isoform X1 [Nilaparvata lugens]|uniref:G patch domain and ankyrin repeat-containing protein 1 homolog isoform X1 n=1 Tax=Nilaparvata lugens TaxID=108931 RepID=UPI00193CC773|nr:G patch domain and ankyrin repeat-containing protein 1 homolog isoform X1 [Nilaparvata lugens]XP_039277052.1 G patch domain and ankyrin repeat-containing protein 1 homolog isoform X1 [Nilaparvata lugens]